MESEFTPDDTNIDDSAGSDPLELLVLASMARQHQTDARTFLRSLANLLESVLPAEATVHRSGLFGGDKRPVRRIELSLPADDSSANLVRYAIEDAGGGPLTATRTQVVRGIALKTESLPVKDWISHVAGGITRRAATDRATRDALAGLV